MFSWIISHVMTPHFSHSSVQQQQPNEQQLPLKWEWITATQCDSGCLSFLQITPTLTTAHSLVHSPSTSLQTWPPYDRRCFSGQYAANSLLLGAVYQQQHQQHSPCAKTADQRGDDGALTHGEQFRTSLHISNAEQFRSPFHMQHFCRG